MSALAMSSLHSCAAGPGKTVDNNAARICSASDGAPTFSARLAPSSPVGRARLGSPALKKCQAISSAGDWPSIGFSPSNTSPTLRCKCRRAGPATA